MSEVAGLWTELLSFYETADADDFRVLLQRHNLGVFHRPNIGLHIDFSEGSAGEPSRGDQTHGLAFYLVPPVHDLFMGNATVTGLRTWAESHGLDLLSKQLAKLGIDAMAQARECLLADLGAVKLVRWEISRALRKSKQVRELIIVRMAADTMAWTFAWAQRNGGAVK